MLPVFPSHLAGRGIHVPIVIYLGMSKFIAAWGIMQAYDEKPLRENSSPDIRKLASLS
jgi:hypothetical protein